MSLTFFDQIKMKHNINQSQNAIMNHNILQPLSAIEQTENSEHDKDFILNPATFQNKRTLNLTVNIIHNNSSKDTKKGVYIPNVFTPTIGDNKISYKNHILANGMIINKEKIL